MLNHAQSDATRKVGRGVCTRVMGESGPGYRGFLSGTGTRVVGARVAAIKA